MQHCGVKNNIVSLCVPYNYLNRNTCSYCSCFLIAVRLLLLLQKSLHRNSDPKNKGTSAGFQTCGVLCIDNVEFSFHLRKVCFSSHKLLGYVFRSCCDWTLLKPTLTPYATLFLLIIYSSSSQHCCSGIYASFLVLQK